MCGQRFSGFPVSATGAASEPALGTGSVGNSPAAVLLAAEHWERTKALDRRYRNGSDSTQLEGLRRHWAMSQTRKRKHSICLHQVNFPDLIDANRVNNFSSSSALLFSDNAVPPAVYYLYHSDNVYPRPLYVPNAPQLCLQPFPTDPVPSAGPDATPDSEP
jgi:hypothetical protein